VIAYHPSFWVSGAILSSIPWDSAPQLAFIRIIRSACRGDVPRSLMLYTPAALELALRCPLAASLGGDDERPCTAESTLVSGSDMLSGLLVDLIRPEMEGSAGWMIYCSNCVSTLFSVVASSPQDAGNIPVLC
jgi:hypothetical protein